jgi:hypothetical protein
VALRERGVELDEEVGGLADEIARHNASAEESRRLRKLMAGQMTDQDIEAGEDGVVYRTMAAYARDVILTGTGRVQSQIQSQYGDKSGVQAARERLEML